jgi:hypothetical protein
MVVDVSVASVAPVVAGETDVTGATAVEEAFVPALLPQADAMATARTGTTTLRRGVDIRGDAMSLLPQSWVAKRRDSFRCASA